MPGCCVTTCLRLCFVFLGQEGNGENAGGDGQKQLFLQPWLLKNQLPARWHSVRARAGASWCLQLLFVISCIVLFVADALWREAKTLHANPKMSAGSNIFRRFHM